MNEDRIEQLLQEADRAVCGSYMSPDVISSTVRNRARKKRIVNNIAIITVGGLIIISLTVWNLVPRTAERMQDKNKIASLEEQVRQLQAKTDATLKFVSEVLEREEKQQYIYKLNAELANIPDPIEEAKKQINKTAFTIVYQADRMYRESGQKEAAVEAYKQVIKLFPQTPSADVARQRLLEIQNNKVDNKI